MGGFYGSVQVRAMDRDRVRSALEELARAKQRFLLGPVLNGWVGVYPEGGGQDFGVARDLAQRLGGELIASLVHDDDIFAYEYYRQGECADQYNSIPDYFDEVSEAERQHLAGRPETFAHLASDPDRFAAVSERMAAQAEAREVIASELLAEFAEALGIRNAVTSYEYMKDNEETEDIKGWGKFIHIPDLSEEKARRKAAKAAILNEKKLLTKQGKLLAERGGLKGWASPAPWWCPAPDRHGFLVAWSSDIDPREQRLPVELHGAPWSAGPQTTPWAISPRVYGMELSLSGRYLAVAHAAGDWKASLWDLEENRSIAEVSQVRAVSSVGFLADESAMFSVSSHGDEGRVILTPIGSGEPHVINLAGVEQATVHPKGAWLVVIDNLNRMHILDVVSGQVVRKHYVGGRYDPTDLERQIMASLQASLSIADSDARSEQVRGLDEKALERYAKVGLPKGVSIEDMRKQLEETMAKLGQGLARQSAALANRGAEKAFRVRFDLDGEWLFVATMGGARVYAWSDVLETEDLRPAFSVDVPGMMIETDQGEVRREGYVYDLDHDTDRNRLLFAGLDGRVRFLDLASGKSGVLLEPPGLPPILRLGLSRDRATLALTCSPDMFDQRSQKRGPVLQFWDYEAIIRG